MIQGPKETSQRKKASLPEDALPEIEEAEVMGEGLGESVESKRYMCMHAKLFQSCPTLCNPMDYSPPGSSVHGFLQARILEWVAMPSSRGSFGPRIMSPALAGGFFTTSTITSGF